MSMPYGTPPPRQASGRGAGLDLGSILGPAAGLLGLAIWFCALSGEAQLYVGGIPLALFLTGGLLAAATVLPDAPRTLVPAAVASAVGLLSLLLIVIAGPSVDGESTPALVFVILVLGLLQLAACVVALLLAAGLIPSPMGGSSRPERGPQSGSFPASPEGPPLGRGQPGYGPGVPPPGYAPPPGSGPPPGYSASPGYGPPPGYSASPGYGPPAGYSASPGYGPPAGYSASPGYGPPPHSESAGSGYGSPGYGGPGSGTPEYGGPGYGSPGRASPVSGGSGGPPPWPHPGAPSGPGPQSEPATGPQSSGPPQSGEPQPTRQMPAPPPDEADRPGPG